MSTQLGWGAGEIVRGFEADICEATDLALNTDPTNPIEVQRALLQIERLMNALYRRVQTDLRPALQRRAPAEPTAEQRQREIERRVAELETWRQKVDPVIDAAEQRDAQRY